MSTKRETEGGFNKILATALHSSTYEPGVFWRGGFSSILKKEGEQKGWKITGVVLLRDPRLLFLTGSLVSLLNSLLKIIYFKSFLLTD
jgi:hypothetical protein